VAFSEDYAAGLSGGGAFTFPRVKPGKYNLSALYGDGSGEYWVNRETNDFNTIDVGPLCPLDLGTYSYS
jgi:hypothetical protein